MGFVKGCVDIMTGDADLRAAAAQKGIVVRGMLWTLDQLELSEKVDRATLHTGLSQIAGHRRCRLPKADLDARLGRWSDSR